jgi:ParB/RepB/Spo0J family partition protein
MSTLATLNLAEQVYEIPTDRIIESSIPNYRRKRNSAKDAELTASVGRSGVQSPLAVRAVGDSDDYELIFGFRRLDAAKEAGLTVVPCVVRHLTDEQVHEARLVENAQRDDPDPLDQAEEYAGFLKRGIGAQAIAERLGQPVRYVLQRLALNELCSAGQKALEQGFISLDVAVLIARLPSERIQTEALRRVNADKGGYIDGVMLLDVAREEIELHVMLDLSEAPFKLDDAELVPEAGPCTTCKKRTGNQAELFADASKGDLCIDSACHRSKLDALHQLRVKQAKVEGVAVVPPKKAREIIESAYGFSNGALVRLDARVTVGTKEKSVQQLLGKELPPVTITQDPKTGLTVELVPRTALQVAQAKATKDAGKKPATAAAKEREQDRLDAEVRRRVMVDLVKGAESTECPSSHKRLVLRAAVQAVAADVRKAVANRRGCPLTLEQGAPTTKKGKGKRQEVLDPAARLNRLIEELDMHQADGLLLELLLHNSAPGKWSEAHEVYAEACAELGVDPKAIETKLKAEKKAKGAKVGK